MRIDEEDAKGYVTTSSSNIRKYGKFITDDNFILDILRKRDLPTSTIKYLHLDLQKNIDFLIEYVKIYHEKNANISTIIYSYFNRDAIKGNNKFWDVMKELYPNMTHDEYRALRFTNEIEYLRAQYEHDLKKFKREIKYYDLDKFKKQIPIVLKRNYEFMLYAAEINPEFYRCASEELKNDPGFREKCIEKNPIVEKIILEEENEKERRKQQRKKREEAIRMRRDQAAEKTKDEYRQLGGAHPNYILVDEYLRGNESIATFCYRKRNTRI